MSTTAALSPRQVLDWLVENQFVRAEKVAEFRDPARYPEAHAVAKALITRGLLTPYQANQVLQGRGAELLFGDTRLMERVGEGAMGQVFKAWDKKFDRVVAVKVIHKDHVASGKAMSRFHKEIEAASKLDHPNIVLLRYADEKDGRPYMVMDFIDGIDLSRLVKTKGPLPIEAACEYVRQAALGLHHAFARGIVHRDIKPGNLLLTMGPDGRALVRILDFGLARFESEREAKNRLTMMGAILGTVDYVAPEQAENAQKADTRADIFALGATLFYLLTGKAPYPGNTVVEKITARLMSEPPSVRGVRPEIPPALDTVVRKMMARKPEDRFPTPLDVAGALQMFVPAGAMPFQSHVLRIAPPPPPTDFSIAPPPNHPEPASVDTLGFSNSVTDLTPEQMIKRATTRPMSRGSEAFARLMKNKAFLLACGGGFLFLILLVVIVLLVAR